MENQTERIVFVTPSGAEVSLHRVDTGSHILIEVHARPGQYQQMYFPVADWQRFRREMDHLLCVS